jgi:prolyl-tRNA synthetase
VYQIQTKFRNEPRAKSGILRGREFMMKDMYSFHASQEDLDSFYEKAIVAYGNIYKRCGIGDKTVLTFASGGVFSKYSHEFQTITPAGEDLIYKINENLALNDEIIDDPNVLKEFNIKDKSALATEKTIEVGNIFKLGTKFSGAFGLKYNDRDGSEKIPVMGCYGIGISRIMGAIVECLGDEKGLVWPEEVAPFRTHLACLSFKDEEIAKCDEIYDRILKAGIDVLYDDRRDATAGEKLNDADLFGIPHRLVVSGKTLGAGKVEYKKRTEATAQLMELDGFISLVAGKF